MTLAAKYSRASKAHYGFVIMTKPAQLVPETDRRMKVSRRESGMLRPGNASR